MCVAKEFAGNGCTCMPYGRDGLLVAGQIMVGIAFATAPFAGVIALLLGLATVILVLLTCCCAMDKCGIMTGASFSLASMGVAGAAGVFYFYAADVCSNPDMYDDDYFTISFDESTECDTLTAIGIVQCVGAILFLVGSITLFMFGCTKLDKHLARKAAENQMNLAGSAIQATVITHSQSKPAYVVEMQP